MIARCTVSTASARSGSSATIRTLRGTPGPPKVSKFRNASQRNSSGIITSVSAPSSSRSGRCSRRPSGNPASRYTSGSSHMSPSQIPTVSGNGATQPRSSCDTNHVSPITTISTPTWFSGRRVHATQPLARKDQPRSRPRNGSIVNGSSAATTTAAVPEASPTAIRVRLGSVERARRSDGRSVGVTSATAVPATVPARVVAR